MTMNVTLIGDKELVQKLSGMSKKVHQSLLAEVTKQALDLQRHVVEDKLQGQVLNHISGKLQASIQNEVTDTQSSVVGRVYSNNSVNYAGIHEFGGVIHHPGGTPYLYGLDGVKFISNAAADAIGKRLPRTSAHTITMPERSFMRSSLADYKDKIIAGMTRAVKDAAS